MGITRLNVKNFKSFTDLTISLKPPSIFIGANASGKSNFVQILRFLKDAAIDGLEAAISQQGDAKYLLNLSPGTSREFHIAVDTDQTLGFYLNAGDLPQSHSTTHAHFVFADTKSITYRFGLQFGKRGRNFTIIEDSIELTADFTAHKHYMRERHGHASEPLGSGQIKYERQGNNVTAKCTPDRVDIQSAKDCDVRSIALEVPLPHEFKLQPHTSLAFNSPNVGGYYRDQGYVPLHNFFKNIGIYDIDAKLCKRAVPITGKTDLAEDGSNRGHRNRCVNEIRRRGASG